MQRDRSRSSVQRACLHCGTLFFPLYKALQRGGGHYCTNTCYHLARIRPLEDRFWEKVQKTESCWIWTASTHVGYGWIGRDQDGSVQAHRIAMEWALGRPLTSAETVCHTCDNRLCVANSGGPDTYVVDGVSYLRRGHLFLATIPVNIRDAAQKGRSVKGERHGSAKLSEEDVTQIRALYAEGVHSQKTLAVRFGIEQTTVSQIILRKNWKHV